MPEVHIPSGKFGFAGYVKASEAESASQIFRQNKCWQGLNRSYADLESPYHHITYHHIT